MEKWSHLPNAKHIDWVLQSVKDNSREWTAARDAAWESAGDVIEADRDYARAVVE